MIRFILFLLVAATGSAQTFVKGHPPIPLNSQVTCATSDSTNAHSRFIEGFQTPTTGYESNIWTALGTTANIFPAADSSSLSTYKPNGACSQAFKVIVPTTGTSTSSRSDLGAGSIVDLDTGSGVDVYFSLYVETAPDNNEGYFCFAYQSTGSSVNNEAGVRIVTVAGVTTLNAYGAANSGLIIISTGQWYVVKLSFDAAQGVAGSSISVYSNNTQVGTTQTFRRYAGEDIRYMWLGAPYDLDSNDSGTLWYDLLQIQVN